MKLNIKWTLPVVLLSLFTVTSCKKFLQVEQLGKTSMPVFFSDMDGIRAGMAGAYSSMYKYYSAHFYTYPEIAGDMLSLNLNLATESQKNLYNFQAGADDEVGAVGKIWADIYIAMSNVNNILFYLPELQAKFPAHQRELQTYQAEALFLRALCHFDLSRVYAQPYNFTPNASHPGIPVLKRTPGPDDNPSRKPMSEVYNFILDDLKESERLFEGAGPKSIFFAGRQAVRALLSRVYLYKEDWAKAAEYATLVINDRPLPSGASYLEAFSRLTGDDAESIFRLSGFDKNTPLLSFYNMAPIVVQGVLTGYTTPVAVPANKYLELFSDPSDIRFSELLQRDSSTSVVRVATAKYNVPQASGAADKQYYNPFVLRISEVYLNRAEAYLQQNDLPKAAADVRPLIARGLQRPASEIVIDETDKAALTQIIYSERARELSFEGHRFFDIARRKNNLNRDPHTNSEVVSMTYPNERFVLPISQKELDANKNMTGNPGVNQ